MYTINLTHFDDIAPDNRFALPDSWQFKAHMRLPVHFKTGEPGELILSHEARPGVWRTRFEREGSAYDARAFELGKLAASRVMVTAMPGRTQPDELVWNGVIRLVATQESPFQAA